jgi:HD-GYP domain-containing protein (c-di-GMP phosphodiesterase class II)
MELRAKIILTISLVLILAVGVSTVLFMNFQQERLIESKTTDVEVIGSIIHSGVDDAMSTGETLVVQRILENMGKNPELLTLRILSPEGHILKSKSPEEIGLMSEDFPAVSGQLSRKMSFVDGNTITYFSPVPNRLECHGCHAETADLNGIVEVKIDIQRSRDEIEAAKRGLVVSGIATVLMVALILSFMINKMVLRPVMSFMDVMDAVQGGDVDARMPVRSMDDFRDLSRSFNKMLDEVSSLHLMNLRKEKDMSKVRVELSHKALLEELNTELQHKVREVESANRAVLKLSKEVKSKNIELEKMIDRLKRINEIGRVLTSTIDYEDLLKVIIKTAAATIKADTASIYVSRGKEKRTAFVYESTVGLARSDLPAAEINPMYNEIFSEGRQVLLNEESPDNPEEVKCHIGGPLRMKGKIIGGMILSKRHDGTWYTHDDLEILDTISNHAIVSLENAWLYETVKSNYFGTIQSLVNALEASDRYTKGHSERVRALVIELAKFIGLDPRELEILEHAAILHDIGKIGIDAAVLNKEDELTTTEFSLIRAHPIIGDEILGPIGTLQGVRTTILQHHERYDGKGYPYGISGEEITLKARLLAVIDTFDAMVTDRPYRKSLSFDDVLDELRKGSGTQFDPVILNAFLEMIKEREGLLRDAGYSVS